jgi:hypothetical protein
MAVVAVVEITRECVVAQSEMSHSFLIIKEYGYV